MTARSASRSAAAVPPLEMRSQPSAAELAGQLDDAGLVVHGQQGPHGRLSFLLEEGRVGEDRPDGVGVEAALDGLDALVQRGLVVVVEDRHGLLGQDRAGVDLERRRRGRCSR